MSENQPAVLDFEKKINEIEEKIKMLNTLAKDSDVDIGKELNRLQLKLEKQIKQSYANLTPWQRVQIARHPERPQCLDYIKGLIEDFVPLSGDRLFADDATMIGGIGRFKGISVVVLGQEKGRDLETRVKYNFGMAKPEGYRKAQRLMSLADKFNLPVICFVDTDGAYPGIESEARGQAEAIASSIQKCLQIKVPLISVVIGMGGSGGKAGRGGDSRVARRQVRQCADSGAQHAAPVSQCGYGACLPQSDRYRGRNCGHGGHQAVSAADADSCIPDCGCLPGTARKPSHSHGCLHGGGRQPL